MMRESQVRKDVTTCTTGTCPCNTAKVSGVACRVSGKTEGCLCTEFGTWGRDTGKVGWVGRREKGEGERYEAIKTTAWPTGHNTSSCREERGDRKPYMIN